MQLVRSSAKVGDTNAEALYYLAIASAQRSIELTAAYFVPRPAFTDALCAAAERGVDVRILVPGPAHRQGLRPRRRARRLRRSCSTPGCGCSSTSRRCCTRRRSAVDGAWSSVGTINFDNRSFQLHDEVTLGSGTSASPPSSREAVRGRPRALGGDRRRALAPPRPARSAPARRRRPCSAASSEPPYPAPCCTQKRRDRALARGAGSLPGRAVARRNPVLAALGDADQAVLRFLRTRGHRRAGGDGDAGARHGRRVRRRLGRRSAPSARRSTTGGAASGSLARRRRARRRSASTSSSRSRVGRQRPLIEDHPPLAKAPTKLSFPSAHATSSVAAATALGRVEPRARPYLFALAAAICVGRPYLGMHYPSDVLGGAALGFCLGIAGPRPRRRADRGAPLRPRGRRQRARAGEPSRAGNGGAATASDDWAPADTASGPA